MNEKKEITHLEIYERLILVEQKVDKIETNTEGMVKAFHAASGAFAVLEWMAKAVKPILWIGALAVAVVAAWENFGRR